MGSPLLYEPIKRAAQALEHEATLIESFQSLTCQEALFPPFSPALLPPSQLWLSGLWQRPFAGGVMCDKQPLQARKEKTS